jgi:hypothetical protein
MIAVQHDPLEHQPLQLRQEHHAFLLMRVGAGDDGAAEPIRANGGLTRGARTT